MTSSDKKTENSGKEISPAKRIWRWLGRIAIILAVLIVIYVSFHLLYPVWINTRLPADAPRIAFSLDNSLLGRIGITDATYQRVMTAAGGRLITLRPDAAGTVGCATCCTRVILIRVGKNGICPPYFSSSG